MKCILLRDSNKVSRSTKPERKSFVIMGRNRVLIREFHADREGWGGRVIPEEPWWATKIWKRLQPLSCLEAAGYLITESRSIIKIGGTSGGCQLQIHTLSYGLFALLAFLPSAIFFFLQNKGGSPPLDPPLELARGLWLYPTPGEIIVTGNYQICWFIPGRMFDSFIFYILPSEKCHNQYFY